MSAIDFQHIISSRAFFAVALFPEMQALKESKDASVIKRSVQSINIYPTQIPELKAPWAHAILLDPRRYFGSDTLAARINTRKTLRASKTRVAAVVELLQKLQNGSPLGNKCLIERPLTGAEYKQLLDEISKTKNFKHI